MCIIYVMVTGPCHYSIGRGVVASRYMDPVKVTKPTTSKPSLKTTKPAETKTGKVTLLHA